MEGLPAGLQPVLQLPANGFPRQPFFRALAAPAAPASLEGHRWSPLCGSSAAQPAFPSAHLAPASTKALLHWPGSAFLIITPGKLSLMNPSWETFFLLHLIKLLVYFFLQCCSYSTPHPALCPADRPLAGGDEGLPACLDPNLSLPPECHTCGLPAHPVPGSTACCGALPVSPVPTLAGAGSTSSIPHPPDSIPRSEPPCEPPQHRLPLGR